MGRKKDPIDWHGNPGYCFPDPGKLQDVKCGVCGTNMDVLRNVLGPTSFVESIGGGKHLHDTFHCPHWQEAWHKQIAEIKIDVYLAEIDEVADYETRKRIAENKILKILTEHNKLNS